MKKEAAKGKDAKRRGNEKPISLAPLSFDEALTGLLQTDAQAVKELERKDRLRREKKRAAKKKR